MIYFGWILCVNLSNLQYHRNKIAYCNVIHSIPEMWSTENEWTIGMIKSILEKSIGFTNLFPVGYAGQLACRHQQHHRKHQDYYEEHNKFGHCLRCNQIDSIHSNDWSWMVRCGSFVVDFITSQFVGMLSIAEDKRPVLVCGQCCEQIPNARILDRFINLYRYFGSMNLSLKFLVISRNRMHMNRNSFLFETQSGMGIWFWWIRPKIQIISKSNCRWSNVQRV